MIMDNNNKAFNEEMSERVDRFLSKEMDDAESKAFMNEVKANPELKEYYIRQFNLMRGIKFNKMMGEMKAAEIELAKKESGPVIIKVDFVSRYKYVLRTVAVAAMLVAGVFIWDGSVTRNVGEQMYTTVKGIVRGGDKIDEMVEHGNYKDAISLIDEELVQEYELGEDPIAIAAYTQSMNDLKYRKAIIYLKMGKKHKAKTILKELDDDRSRDVLDKLLW